MTKPNIRILIVDDDEDICMMLSQLMKREGFSPTMVNDGGPALKEVRSKSPDVMLLDIRMPSMDGTEVLGLVKEIDPDLPIVIITAHGEIRGAVEAIKGGAHDYLAKPFDNNEVIRVVHRALSEGELKRKLKNLTRHFVKDGHLRELMGPSDAVGELISMVNRVAQSNFTVVIQGETGSGKELVSQAIHSASSRSKGPFIPVDCGAIPETLLESELFGHERGAFTGAAHRKTGKIQSTNGGTLFLDEVSNLPLASQAKLLRVIQEKRVFPVGSSKHVNIDVRFLTASNKDLYGLTESGHFRSDLFFRLNEFIIKVPPLRERQEDILYLAKRFLDITNVELNKDVKGFSESALETLLAFSWPGNVREFRSTIRRAVLLANDVITENHLDIEKRREEPFFVASPKINGMPPEELSLKEIVRQNTVAVERKVLAQVLKYTGGNKAKAARLLKIDYKTMHTKVNQLGINT
ncbi:MAG: sigma-54-dependent Fis family transcriptional regulator [Desulfobacteraceae bacterium]|nr:sigma-54-dependent Fis family transcriptional regulator [Desulfobacteraceae bacterium]